MTTELHAVAANGALLLGILMFQQFHHDLTRGVFWAFGNRDNQTSTELGERVVRQCAEGRNGSCTSAPP